MGCHLEEVNEMFAAMSPEKSKFLEHMANYFKTTDEYILDAVDKVELLDALCDQIVTAIGVGHMMGWDILGALNEVISSNDSKRDENGNFIFDENGKIKKSEHYFKPNLVRFLND